MTNKRFMNDTIEIAKRSHHDAIDYIIKNDPKAYLLHGAAIESKLRNIEMDTPRPNDPLKYTLDQFTYPLQWDRTKALILHGPSNIGKTAYARALLGGRCLYANLFECLRQLDPAFHDGILFDDATFKRVPIEKQISLLNIMENRDIKVGHKLVHIPARMPIIFTTSGRDPYIYGLDRLVIMNNCQIEHPNSLY